MAYFQDLPEDYQNKIVSALRNEGEVVDVLDDEDCILEATHDYINCNNTEKNVSEWVNSYCL